MHRSDVMESYGTHYTNVVETVIERNLANV